MMNMEQKKVKIKGIPIIIWGTSSERVCLYIHGQGGNKEEAKVIANIICQRGWQVLSMDLPKHGDRQFKAKTFEPWNVVPELSMIMEYAKYHWKDISLFANSIGAWFSMLAFTDEPIKKCLFLSPVLDMKQLVLKMMKWANVTEAQLEQESVIHTDFNQTLSWKYWNYILAHPIITWKIPTKILFGENDNLIDRSIVNQFVQKYACDLSVMKNGEHWFHTEQQLEILEKWIEHSF